MVYTYSVDNPVPLYNILVAILDIEVACIFSSQYSRYSDETANDKIGRFTVYLKAAMQLFFLL